MKTDTLLAIALAFSVSIATAQTAPAKQWDARFGGSSGDFLQSLHQTADGGYILGGSSYSGISGDKTQASQGYNDYWIVKTDSGGVKQWDARFGGSDDDYLFSLEQTTDGGYILGGYSGSGISGDKTQASQGNNDYWIVKTDAGGVKQWDARFGGSDYDNLQSVHQTSDGGYILGGSSSSGISGDKTQTSQGGYDYWLVKTDAGGVKQWDAQFGGSSTDYLYSLQQTSDGGYIVGGSSFSGISGDKTQASQGGDDYWIVKTDAGGVKQWDARFGGSGDDWLYSLQQTADGGYILGGQSSSGISGDKTQASQGGYDYWIVKTDAGGVKQWDARFGGSDYDYFLSLQQTADGGYILGGYSDSGISGDKTQVSQGYTDYWIVKTDSGATTCQFPTSLYITNLTATSAKLNWDAVVGAIKYKVNYKVTGSNSWITVTNISSNSTTISGLSPNTSYHWKVKSVCGAQPIVSSDWSAKKHFTTGSLKLGATADETVFDVYPIPANETATIAITLSQQQSLSIKLFDILGREVFSSEEGTVSGTFTKQLDLSNLPSGTYFLKVIHDGVSEMRKMVVEK